MHQNGGGEVGRDKDRLRLKCGSREAAAFAAATCTVWQISLSAKEQGGRSLVGAWYGGPLV